MLWSARVNFDGSYTTITDIQDVSISGGRQALVDNFSATRCTITCRYPNGYVSPISGLVPGAPISVEMRNEPTHTTTFGVFIGYVADVEVKYGMPFANDVGAADYLIITCEGPFARLARATGNGYAMPSEKIIDQTTRANQQTQVDILYGSADFSRVMSATTVDGSWADWLNQLVLSIAGRIRDSDPINVQSQNPDPSGSTFSDSATPAAGDLPYNSIAFDSLAQNYFNQITVDPVSFATQTVSNIPIGESPRNYTVDTYSGSDSQATDLANFYLSQFGTPTVGISQISFTFNALDTAALQSAVREIFLVGFSPVGKSFPVVFRGTSYLAVVEGFELSLTPASQTCTFYVSDNSLNNFLLLNSTVFGQLDFNKLGF